MGARSYLPRVDINAKSRMTTSFAVLLFLMIGILPSHQDVIEDVLTSLRKGVSFLEKHSKSINLDGVVGYKILHVQLVEAVHSWPRDLDNIAQRATASSLIKRLDKSLPQAVKSLQQTEPKYFREFEPLMDKSFWSLPEDWTTTDPSLAYGTKRTTECYDEQLSDKCMTLLLGTWKDNGTPCIVTKPCRDTMTRFGCSHYSLSHQLLYFMIGTMNGCNKMLKGEMRPSRVNMTVPHYQRIFCSNMMKSNKEMFRNGCNWETQDIFIENILLCGLAGFSDFYNLDWLDQMLMWQDPVDGCFGKVYDFSLGFPEERVELQPHKRVKRRDQILRDGCSSHMTGVAMSALGGYLNFYLSQQDITKRPLA